MDWFKEGQEKPEMTWTEFRKQAHDHMGFRVALINRHYDAFFAKYGDPPYLAGSEAAAALDRMVRAHERNVS